MADTIEKRVEDIEHILAHLPEDLDARFAGVDLKLAGLREVLALHTTRFSKLDARLSALEARLSSLDAKLEARLDMMAGSNDQQFGAVLSALAEIRGLLPPKP